MIHGLNRGSIGTWAASYGGMMVLGCVIGVVVVAFVFVLDMPKWLIIAALLVCPSALAVIALVNRRARGADGA